MHIRHWTRVPASVFFLLFVSGCDSADLPTSATMEVGADENNSEIRLGIGDLLVVRLESNPTTGFSWEIAELDRSILEANGEPEFQPHSDALGSGGTETFRFRARRSGRTDLRMIYHRPWETDVAPLERFHLSISVA